MALSTRLPRLARFGLDTAAIAGAALMLAAISNHFARPERRVAWFESRENGLAPPLSAAPPAGAPAGESAAARPWKEITPEETHALFVARALFFDARRSSAYREGHISGARSISVWEEGLDQKIQQFYEEGHLPDTLLVVYCSGGDCEDSHLLAERLWGLGFNRVVVYKDGFPDWKARGWPVATGASP